MQRSHLQRELLRSEPSQSTCGRLHREAAQPIEWRALEWPATLGDSDSLVPLLLPGPVPRVRALRRHGLPQIETIQSPKPRITRTNPAQEEG
jgi:hypothetical protein